MRNGTKIFIALLLSMAIVSIVVEPVSATTISDLETQIQQNQDALDDINDQIDDMESAQELLEVEYQKALAMEQTQYEEMLVRIKFMYEQGDSNFITMLFGSNSFSEMLNKADYIEQLYNYDRKQLKIYQETTVKVDEMKKELEIEKAELLTEKAALSEQEKDLDTILAKKKAEVKNYEAMVKEAQKEAKKFKDQIKKEQKELEKLQAQMAQGGNTAANNGNYTVTGFDTSIIDNASGSELGKNIAKYGCQFIGNPYVYGGTSLTQGADCSGFTYRIYADFGYAIPRTSKDQRSCGTGVTLETAQPGDLVCYDGHVGLYVGGGYIVHASTEKTGIKISKATYRKILAVRRVIS